MKLTQNIKAISRLSLIILFSISFVIGAFLSYLWAIGPIIELGITIPDKPSVAITDVSFTPQNTSYFNLTLLNPSYSPSKANIMGILTLTEGEKTHTVTDVDPPLPYELLDGYNQTFQCFWNWANYTGQIIGIYAFVEGGSGPTSVGVVPFVGLQITDVDFDSSFSITSFDLTVQSHENSTTYVNITDITVQTTTLEAENVTPLLPYTLNPNSSVTFKCLWNWTDYQNTSVTIAVNTLQGYVSYTTHLTPEPVVLEVTDALFSETDVNHFNVTIRNSELSPGYLNISRISLTLKNRTVVEINGTEIKPSLPHPLEPNSSETFECPWNWSTYRNKNVTLSVNTLQNYTVHYTTVTPSPIKIVNAIFDLENTNSFNVTVQNSEFYTAYVNLTDVTLVLENETIRINGTEIKPSLPHPLEPNSSETFECPWNWTNYQGKSVTIMISSTENYTIEFTRVTPIRVFFAIVSVVFDPIDTKSFNITVRNSEFSLDKAYITKITLTLRNETVIDIRDVIPILPYPIDPNSTAPFQCLWDWTNYRNENIVITVHVREGNMVSTQYTTPPAYP